MSILSFEFLVFVAGVLLVQYLLPKQVRWLGLLVASIGFYLASGWQGGVYLGTVALLTWLTGLRLARLRGRMEEARTAGETSRAGQIRARMRLWLTLCLLAVLGAMVFIKYADAGRQAINALLAHGGSGTELPAFHILVPLGLSYFTFQSVGYVIDVYWGKIPAQTNYLKHLLFAGYFPQVIQGPVSTWQQLAPQLLSPRAFHPQRFTMGFQLMLWGYFKKLVLADRLAGVTVAVFAGTNQPGWLILLGVMLYSVRLYGDFSGGMDVVRGISLMLGVELTENFRRPFFSCSVAEYWRRWHISLGTWFRTYVLYPLSTSRFGAVMAAAGKRLLGKKAGRMLPGAASTFIIFLLIGMWHTASWNAVVYGAYFGLLMGGAMLLEPQFKALRRHLRCAEHPRRWRAFGWVRTMLLLLPAQYFAVSAGPAQGLALMLGTFRSWDFSAFVPTVTALLGGLEWGIAGGALLLVAAVDGLCECGVDINGRMACGSFLLRWPALMLLILAILVFGCYGTGFDSAAFMYTNF